MKYLLNIVLLSTLVVFFTACDEENQQDLLTPEISTSKADFLIRPDSGNKTVAQRNPERMFQLLDKDQDNKISLDEAEQAPNKKLSQNFDLIDRNEDGHINLEEVQQLTARAQGAGKGKENPEMIFQLLDQDKDNKISLNEAERAPIKKLSENFDLMDSNADGFIDKEEVEQLSAKVQNTERGERNPEMIFQLLDQDKDNKISLNEAERAPNKKLSENFDLMDSNKDGFIDKEEIMNLRR